MRTTTVPAQITTVEDKIIGEISLVQLLLLVAPVFGSIIIYVGLPPFFASAIYKTVIMVCMMAVFWSLSIRVKGQIILNWLMILMRYGMRPRYYVFNKNDTYMRDLPQPEPPQEVLKKQASEKPVTAPQPDLSTADLVQVEQLIAMPEANLHFRTDKKGALRAYITEVR
jgi:hypothetical protein